MRTVLLSAPHAVCASCCSTPVDTVSKFATEKIAPKVRQMDDEAKIHTDILDGMFEQGVRAITSPHMTSCLPPPLHSHSSWGLRFQLSTEVLGVPSLRLASWLRSWQR